MRVLAAVGKCHRVMRRISLCLLLAYVYDMNLILFHNTVCMQLFVLFVICLKYRDNHNVPLATRHGLLMGLRDYEHVSFAMAAPDMSL